MKKYKILEIGIDLDGGGTDRYMFNYCTRIPDIEFEFASVISKDGMLEKELRDLGYTIHKYPRMKNGLYANFKSFYRIMKANNYDVVHAHLCNWSFVSMFAAMLCGVKVRIAHAHFANIPETKVQHLLRMISTWLTKLFATNLAACGKDAGKWMWGEKLYMSGGVKVHKNAIISDLYKFSKTKREEKRKQLNIVMKQLVVGHVGRISEQKNQIKLVEIFKEIYKRNQSAVLLLIGHSDDSYPLKDAIEASGIKDSIIVLGLRSDVNELLNAMDVFVFPSLYEGLPFTLVETQCNGLPCVCSDMVTSQIKFSDYIKFISLNNSINDWADLAIKEGKRDRGTNAYKDMIKAGYDLETEARKLKDYYINLIEGNE